MFLSVCVPVSVSGKMGRSKSKKSPQPDPSPSTHDPEQVEENPDSNSEADEAWITKYTGENHMTWFKNIIQVQAKHVMNETIEQEVQKIKQQLEARLKEINIVHEESIKEARESIESLEDKVSKMKRRVERLEYSNAQKEAKIKELRLQLDSAEQMEYNHSLQIVGVPEGTDKADDTKQLIKISKELGIKMKSSDIENITRLGKKKDRKTRHLIIQLKDKSMREKLFEQRKKLVKDSNPKKNVYINDRLTKHRQNLLFAARKLVKSKKLFAAWSQQGNILIRKTEDSNIIQVYDHGDLMIIKTDDHSSIDQGTEQNPGTSRDSSVISHLSDYSYYVDSDF